MDAYKKSAELDPPNAAQAYRNGGITLYNAGKMKEAVEPLKKATELDPKSAQAWYLLGASLVGSMDYKQVGNKLEVQEPTSDAPSRYHACALLGSSSVAFLSGSTASFIFPAL